MATVEIKVPIDESLKARTGWIENISQHIDAGNSVEFVNQNGGAGVEVSRVAVATAGYVCVWGLGYSSADAKAIYLEAGGFHTIGGIHGIRAADTTTSIKIHVKI
jgi:hypothetical protein